MHPALQQLISFGTSSLETKSHLIAPWTSDESYITTMWSHPEVTAHNKPGTAKLFQITSVWDGMWKLPFRNQNLRLPEYSLTRGSTSWYLSTLEAAILLEEFEGRKDIKRAQCLAISFDGFQTYHENELVTA